MRSSLWVILLAGGDGTRLRDVPLACGPIDRPKQFHRFGRSRTLFATAFDRALKLTRASRVVALVSAHHRRWWGDQLTNISSENILVQPSNRGTALALLHGVMYVLQRDNQATIVVLPCDHAVRDEAAFVSAIRTAANAATKSARQVTLVGVAPDMAEVDYGWILPEPISANPRRVLRFVEKPPLDTARALMMRGALWNTLAFAGSAAGMADHILRSIPRVVEWYLWHMPRSGWTESRLAACYETAPSVDFARDVLERVREHLAVIEAPACGWTDLGTPARLNAWLAC